jgi:hypothetical protein
MTDAPIDTERIVVIPTAKADWITRTYVPAFRIVGGSEVAPLSIGHQPDLRAAVERARRILETDYPEVEIAE